MSVRVEGLEVETSPTLGMCIHYAKKLDANWKLDDKTSGKRYVEVAFTILRNGVVKDVEIEQSSGNEIYDRAARRAVEYSAPLPPLPREFEEPDLRVHVKFNLKR